MSVICESHSIRTTEVCLVLIIGIPGCGKTELCNLLSSKFSFESEGYYKVIHICYDDIIKEVNSNWRASRDSLLENVDRQIITYLKDSSLNGFKILILVDDNMYYQSMRRMYHRLAMKRNYAFCQIFMNCALDAAIARVQDRNKRSSLKVELNTIREMISKFETPNPKNNWETCTLSIDTTPSKETEHHDFIYHINGNKDNKEVVKSVKNLVYEAFSTQKVQPMKQQPSVQKPPDSIAMHELDIAVRKCISSKIINLQRNGMTKERLKIFAGKLNDKRRSILSSVSKRELQNLSIHHIVDEIFESICI